MFLVVLVFIMVQTVFYFCVYSISLYEGIVRLILVFGTSDSK